MASTRGGEAQCAQCDVVAVADFPVVLAVADNGTDGVYVRTAFDGVAKGQTLVPQAEAQRLGVVVDTQIELVEFALRHVIERDDEVTVVLVAHVVHDRHAPSPVYRCFDIHRIDVRGIQTFVRIVQVIK